MSFINTPGNNVGFKQKLSDATCASQFKMAVSTPPQKIQPRVQQFIQSNRPREHPMMNKIKLTNEKLRKSFPLTKPISKQGAGKNDSQMIRVTNGVLNTTTVKISNGHLTQKTQSNVAVKPQIPNRNIKVVNREMYKPNVVEATRSTTSVAKVVAASSKPSANSTSGPVKVPTQQSKSFLDVFKRELIDHKPCDKDESSANNTKISTTKKSVSGKQSSNSRSKKGRGPAVHEALQRIQSKSRAPEVVKPLIAPEWHVPASEYDSSHTDDILEISSDEDDFLPCYSACKWSECTYGSNTNRGTRLAARRAGLRRQLRLLRAEDNTKLKNAHTLVQIIKKDIMSNNERTSVSPHILSNLLAMRGMSSLLTSDEKRKLRSAGWSDERGVSSRSVSGLCKCGVPTLPLSAWCVNHAEIEAFTICAAMFAQGQRCKQPAVPTDTLCAEHMWKRDNYNKLRVNSKPKVARKRVASTRRNKRKRKSTSTSTCTEINVCSNSSAYESTEEICVETITEPITTTVINTHHHGIDVALSSTGGHDDILDTSVLNQIPDEAFTEFFNQAETGSDLGEPEELARALEAVLDETTLADVFTHNGARTKIALQTAATVEVISSDPS